MRIEGKLTEWNDSKGFGFITPHDGDARVFVHISAFPKGRRPALNNRVSFTLSEDEQQRPRATRIKFTGPPKIRMAVVVSTWNLLITAFAVALLFATLGFMVQQQMIPVYLPIVYGILSIMLFVVYGIDKSAAKNNKQREPEKALHMLAIVGGWPGAWLAQKVFKHKTIKQPFKFIFWCTVVINSGAFLWLVFASSAAGLRTVLGFPA